MERWQGKVAVVTGASSGIGLATIKQLVHHGVIVVGLARRVDKMQNEMKNVKGPGQFYAKQCDITNEQNVIEVFSWIKSTLKSLHILVNNAGLMTHKKIQDSSTEDTESVFKVNVFGLMYCTKQAIKLMKESQTTSHIININSLLGHRVIPNILVDVYPASKFAVTALTESLRNELTDSKIRVSSISPGIVKTEMFEKGVAQNPDSINIPGLKAEDVSNSIMHALSAPPHVEINDIVLQARAV